MKITITDNALMVESPYNTEFVSRARQLGGKWAGKTWKFDPLDEERVRQLCLEIYGTDGTPQETVTLHINLDGVGYLREELVIGPVTVLRKYDRDSTPKLGEGCVVIAGKLQAFGGSRNKPRITFDVGTVIEVRNLPRLAAEQAVESKSGCVIV